MNSHLLFKGLAVFCFSMYVFYKDHIAYYRKAKTSERYLEKLQRLWKDIDTYRENPTLSLANKVFGNIDAYNDYDNKPHSFLFLSNFQVLKKELKDWNYLAIRHEYKTDFFLRDLYLEDFLKKIDKFKKFIFKNRSTSESL